MVLEVLAEASVVVAAVVKHSDSPTGVSARRYDHAAPNGAARPEAGVTPGESQRGQLGDEVGGAQHSIAASRRYGVGDQVKIVAPAHPWKGAIGIIRAPFKAAGLDWEVELETILPGQRAGVAENEIRRV